MMTTEEVAEELRMTPDAIRRMVRQGRITGVKVGKRLLISRDEVDRVLREGTQPVKRTRAGKGTGPVVLAGGRSLSRSQLDNPAQ
jgi:excisionase family DNA binding protein